MNSLFTLSTMVGLSVADLTQATTVANLGFEEITFPAPAFVGDTMYVETEIMTARRSRSRPTQGIIGFEHRANNQDGVLVGRARRSALMLSTPVEGSGDDAPA